MRVLLILLTVLFCFSDLWAQGREWEERYFVGAGNFVLPYRMLRPDGPGPWPLVIFLHGAGERGSDNRAQLRNGAGQFFEGSAFAAQRCLVVAPQCPLDQRWVEVDWGRRGHRLPRDPSQPMLALLHLVPALQQEFGLDQRRFYALGMSMGGYGVWDLLARRPQWFASAVPICGGGDEATAPSLAAIPLWVFHGGQDPVVPVERSRNMVAALRKAGGQPRYTEYPKVGHGSWVQAFQEPELADWILGQQR